MDLPVTSRAPGSTPDSFVPPETRWRELVGTLGHEIAGPLTAALERIHSLISSGRIDRHGLRALRDEVEQVRAVGMAAQQIARLASGRLRQSHEKLSLDEMLFGMLTQRSRETQARGLAIKPRIKHAEVLADSTLLFGLLNTLLDWALRHARDELAFSVDVRVFPAHTRLGCSFPLDTSGPSDSAALKERLDCVTWRLLAQTAQTMGLEVERQDGPTHCELLLLFPQTTNEAMEGVSSIELNDGFALTANSRPLAGSHVLVVASRRELRSQVREAIQHMGLLVDMVASVQEAADFCAEGLPHALVLEGILRGERWRQLAADIRREVPELAFIEIVEEGSGFEMSSPDNGQVARVGREAIDSALPSVLLFELSKGF